MMGHGVPRHRIAERGTRGVVSEIVPRHVDAIEKRAAWAPPELIVDPLQCGNGSPLRPGCRYGNEVDVTRPGMKIAKRCGAGQVKSLQQAGSFGIHRIHVGIDNIPDQVIARIVGRHIERSA
jgi:hypothetical protein